MGHKLIDLTGQRFGKWIVLEKSQTKTKQGKTQWTCQCDCGEIKEISNSNLKYGNSKSCGCSMYKDLTGKKYGRLTPIIRSTKLSPSGKTKWVCRCDCGETTEVIVSDLINGHTESCGCLWLEAMQGMVAEKNPNYNPFISDNQRLVGRYQLYGKSTKKWREEIFQKDDFTCQSCNQRGCQLNAHHLNAWNAFPEQRFDTANGITLCKDCHKEFHHFYGKGDNTLEEFRDHIACIVGEEHVSEIEETLLSRESEIIGQEEVEQPTRELQTT